MDNYYQQLTLKNIGYSSIARALGYVFALTTNIVLGRCLLAADYGVVSFAFIFVNFADKFSDLGISSAIIQRKQLDDETLYTAFTLKFVLGCAVAGAVILLSLTMSYIFDDPGAIRVVRLLSLCFLFNNFSFLPTSLLTREMNFKKISAVETGVSFLNSLIAILLALNGYGYWCIVLAFLFSCFIAAGTLALVRPVAIRFRFNCPVAKELVGFGGYLFLSGLFAFLMSNFDNFIIGAVKGAKDLGHYAVAFNWGSMICTLMYSVVLRVIYPVLAKMQGQVHDLRSSYLKTLEYSGYLIVLANILLLVISKEFLVIVLGQGTDKWLPALTALRILCIYGMVRGLLEPAGQVITALGKTQILFKANLVAAVLEAAAIYPALKFYGIEGVACVVTSAYVSQYFVYYRYLKANLQTNMRDLAKAVRPSFLAAVTVLLLSLTFLQFEADNWFLLAVKISLLVTAYIVTLGLTTHWELFARVRNLLVQEKTAKDAA